MYVYIYIYIVYIIHIYYIYYIYYIYRYIDITFYKYINTYR